MAPYKTAPSPSSGVNNILQNLRGEHFRHARNVLGQTVSSSSLSYHAHNQPSLPLDLIYPTHVQDTISSPSWVPGPCPPRSWRSPTSSSSSHSDDTDTSAWRARALSHLLLATPSRTPSRPIYPNRTPIPQLTLLCLQLIRATCPGTDLDAVVPFIPAHLRRALLRYTAIHAPLSQIELDALCGGSTHVDTELIVVGPHNTLRADVFRRSVAGMHGDSDSWDANLDAQDEPLALCSLGVLSSPLSVATMLAFPPTLTHLALINIPYQIPLSRLPTICPLVILLDLSYNAWLHDVRPPMLEVIEWGKLRRLEVLGLRECPVTPKLLLELNRGRWEGARIIQ